MSCPRVEPGTWHTLVILAAGIAIGAYLRPERATGQVEAPKDQAQAPKIDERLYMGIKRGMILPFCGSELPEGYVWADGMSNWPEADWVPAHLRGKPVPKMDGRVLRGVTATNSIALQGGKDAVPGLETASDGQHQHEYSVPTTTGRITENEPGSDAGGGNYGHGYNLVASSGEYARKFRFAYENAVSGQGNHAHYIGGGKTKTPENQGSHQHNLPEIPVVPSYTAVRYIIRIR